MKKVGTELFVLPAGSWGKRKIETSMQFSREQNEQDGNQATDCSLSRDNPLFAALSLYFLRFFRNLVAIILINHSAEYATLKLYFLDSQSLI